MTTTPQRRPATREVHPVKNSTEYADHTDQLVSFFAERMRSIGIHPAKAAAFEATGVLVTTDNAHLCSDATIETWQEVISDWNGRQAA